MLTLVDYSDDLARTLKLAVAQLTDREQEVLSAMLNGLEASETAEALGIARRTIEVHRLNLRKKLGSYPLPVVAAHIAVIERERGGLLRRSRAGILTYF
jgi:DNA-binding CsgD family transcriptional regulator